MKNMRFGQEETVRVIDDQGSTETLLENYREGGVVSPRRRTFRIRHKISSLEDELHEYALFSKEVSSDPRKLDPEFKVDKKHGQVIWCYTVLEY